MSAGDNQGDDKRKEMIKGIFATIVAVIGVMATVLGFLYNAIRDGDQVLMRVLGNVSAALLVVFIALCIVLGGFYKRYSRVAVVLIIIFASAAGVWIFALTNSAIDSVAVPVMSYQDTASSEPSVPIPTHVPSPSLETDPSDEPSPQPSSENTPDGGVTATPKPSASTKKSTDPPAPSPSAAVASPTPSAASDSPAFTSVKYTSNYYVSGTVSGISDPEDYRVILFIQVGDGEGKYQWYAKPDFLKGQKKELSQLGEDGGFSIRAYHPDKKEQDLTAVKYAVLLVKSSFEGISDIYMYDEALEASVADFEQDINRQG